MRFLTENLALKGVSLALAIGLWFVIAGETTSEIGLSVPVEMQNFPRDLELVGDPANSVEVRLRASPGIIHALASGEVSAQIDLAGAGEGERIVHLTPESMRVPFGVKVVKINPAILTLNFEQTLQKSVPIHPRLVGRPAPGHEVAEVTSQPAEVRIAGPRSRVQEVESAFTEPVSIEGASVAVAGDRNLGLEDPVLRILGSPRVHVTARVREVEEKKAFDDLPVAVRGGAAAVRPGSVRVVLAGPVSALRRISAADVKPYVDVTTLESAGSTRVAVEILPGQAGVRVETVEPQEVQARPTLRRKG
jgi:YbbR domain-containing protein